MKDDVFKDLLPGFIGERHHGSATGNLECRLQELSIFLQFILLCLSVIQIGHIDRRTEFIGVEQFGGLFEFFEIDLHRHRELFRIRFHDKHVPGAQGGHDTGAVIEKHIHFTFEDDDFDEAVGGIFKHDAGARHGSGYGSGSHLGAAQLLRHLKEDHSFFQIDGAVSAVESEHGIGSDPGDGLVRKAQLSARFDTRGNGGLACDFGAYLSGLRCLLDGEHTHVIDDAGELRLLKARCLGRDCCCPDQCAQDQFADWRFGFHHRFGFWVLEAEFQTEATSDGAGLIFEEFDV